MRIHRKKSQILRDQQGATATVVAISLVLLMVCAALAVDLGHLYVARNELQNAADAGALAGARFLHIKDCGTSNMINVSGYTDCESGQVINSANQIAYDAATANVSEGVPVEVNWTSGTNGPEVQRGHWSFTTGEFTPKDNPAQVLFSAVDISQLDTNEEYINAVRVVGRRNAKPVSSFFARIFGREGFQVEAEAVAYVGFSFGVAAGEVEIPIVICKDSITTGDGIFDCNIARMLDSGSKDETHNTGGWTNFDLGKDGDSSCSTASASDMKALVCTGNPDPINFSEYTHIGSTGGVQQVTFDLVRQCWTNQMIDTDGDTVGDQSILNADNTSPMFPNGMPELPWCMTLPVVECDKNNVENCSKLWGIVKMCLLWMTYAGTPNYVDAPKSMSDAAGNSWPEDEDWDMTLDQLVANGGYEYDPAVWNVASPTDITVGEVFDYPQIMSSGYLSAAWLDAQVKDLNGDTIITTDEEALSKETAAREEAGKVRWASFVNSFKLKNNTDEPAPYAKKSMYFLPSCNGDEIKGPSGGLNFGIPAEIPVLVQ